MPTINSGGRVVGGFYFVHPARLLAVIGGRAKHERRVSLTNARAVSGKAGGFPVVVGGRLTRPPIFRGGAPGQRVARYAFAYRFALPAGVDTSARGRGRRGER